jgi:hypothetical protein
MSKSFLEEHLRRRPHQLLPLPQPLIKKTKMMLTTKKVRVGGGGPSLERTPNQAVTIITTGTVEVIEAAAGTDHPGIGPEIGNKFVKIFTSMKELTYLSLCGFSKPTIISGKNKNSFCLKSCFLYFEININYSLNVLLYFASVLFD